jgi:hypothetical protein
MDPVKLVSPYVSGNGANGQPIKIFCDGPQLVPGMVLSTRSGPQIIVMQTDVIEDYFDNIHTASCHVISRDPSQTIDPDFTEVDVMYSVKDIQ